MKIKRCSDMLNENFYEDFGIKEPTYTDNIRSYIVDIIREVEGVSEKSFKKYDEIIERVKGVFNDNQTIIDDVKSFEDRNSRKVFCAESIYDKYKEMFV